MSSFFHWYGACKDADKEQRFLQSQWPAHTDGVRWVVLAAVLAYLAFVPYDWLSVNSPQAWLTSLSLRLPVLITVLICLHFGRGAKFNPLYDRLFLFFQAVTMLSLQAVLFYLSRGVDLDLVGLIVVTLMFYVFAGIAHPLFFAINLLSAIGFILVCSLAREMSLDQWAASVFHLSFVNVMGCVLSRRQSINERQSFFSSEIQAREIQDQHELTKQLERSQERWRSVVSSVPEFVFIVAQDGRIQFINRDLPTLKAENLLGTNICRLLWQDDVQVFNDSIAAVFNGEAIKPLEVRISRNWQAEVWFRCHFGAIYESGAISSVLIISHNVTQLKLKQSALHQSEEQYRNLVEQTSQDLIWAIDKQLRWVFVNRQAVISILGYMPDRIVGQPLYQLVVAYERNRVNGLLNALIQGDASHASFETCLIREDGGIAYVNVNAVPHVDEHDNVIGVMGTCRDITRNKLSEVALRESEERFSRVFEESPDIVFLMRLSDHNILEINHSVERILGYSVVEIIQNPTPLLQQWVKKGGGEIGLDARGQSREARGLTASLQHKNGNLIDCMVSSKIITLNGVDCLLGYCRDMTLQHELESERNQLQKSLVQSQKLEALGQLTGGIAHDFNNILSSIMGYTELALLDTSGNDDQESHLNEVLRGCHRARDLVAQMLTFSRGGEGNPRNVRVAPLLDDAVRLLRATFPSTMEFRIRYNDDDSICLLVDTVQIQQVIMNLAINARDAMQAKGVLTLGVHRTTLSHSVCSSCHEVIGGQYVEFSVADTGSGISAEIMNNIFNPFYTTKEVGSGYGLGLSVVHGIVHRYGGHLLTVSTVNDGSTFRILFPQTNEDLELDQVQEPSAPYQDQDAQGRRVLVVDDDPAIASFLAIFLNRNGFVATAITDAREAWVMLQDTPELFDLLLTDQTMPGLTGLELASKVQSVNASMPIILCTGYSAQVDEDKAVTLGLDGFLQKPVDTSALRNMLGRLLDIPQKSVTEAP